MDSVCSLTLYTARWCPPFKIVGLLLPLPPSPEGPPPSLIPFFPPSLLFLYILFILPKPFLPTSSNTDVCVSVVCVFISNNVCVMRSSVDMYIDNNNFMKERRRKEERERRKERERGGRKRSSRSGRRRATRRRIRRKRRKK